MSATVSKKNWIVLPTHLHGNRIVNNAGSRWFLLIVIKVVTCECQYNLI